MQSEAVLLVEPDASRRQPLKRLELGPALVRLLLDRSSDSASRDEPTQDYLTLRYEPGQLCFAVTDGVSSSFAGELAAQVLARSLVQWLAAQPSFSDERDLSADLSHFLGELTEPGSKLVATYQIPDDLPAIVLDVLEQQRAYGSEAMFVCGRIDWPAHDATRVQLAWLGDAILRVQSSAGRTEHLGGRTIDRWSTLRGPRGQVRAWVQRTSDVCRIIACSDGVLPALSGAVELTDSELEDRLLRLAAEPTSDDLALIDIALTASAMPPTRPASGGDVAGPLTPAAEDPPAESTGISQDEGEDARAENKHNAPAAPRLREKRSDRGRLTLSWEPVPGADSYSVQVSDNPSFADPLLYEVAGTHLELPHMPAARVWARARAVAANHTGAWGDDLAIALTNVPLKPPVAVRETSVTTPDSTTVTGLAPEESAQNLLEAPTDVETKITAMGRLLMRWRPVTGAESYAVNVERADRLGWPSKFSRTNSPQAAFWLAPGRYYIWLRASSAERPGAWSRPVIVRIP